MGFFIQKVNNISKFSRSSHGFMHMRIQLTGGGQYILGQFSRPFNTIAEMINYYTVNRLPIKGAEHTSLRTPPCDQLLQGAAAGG